MTPEEQGQTPEIHEDPIVPTGVFDWNTGTYQEMSLEDIEEKYGDQDE